MALVKGINSYVEVAEADAYFQDRLDVAAWVDADNTQKAQALVTATRILDDLSWNGTAISEDQSLAFPRVGSYFDPRIGALITLSETESPVRLNVAVMELAYHLLNNDGLQDDTGGVRDLIVGSAQLIHLTAPSVIPGNVRRMIKPLLLNQGSHAWWRAN